MVFRKCRESSCLRPVTLVLVLTVMTFTSCQRTEELIQDLEAKMNKKFAALARQLILQQLEIEETARASGTSGIKQQRVNKGGSRPYYAASFRSGGVAAIHDHSNNIRTVGMGEIIVVINGIEFRTRHNDYRLFMPHRTSSNLHEEEEIPFPPVPEAVLNKTTVAEQIAEMREWFKAWKNQDASVRDYTKHFKPVICYMEGAWSVYREKLEESFISDRHRLDAETWYEMEESIRFLSYTGGKHTQEDLAYLPKVIMNVTADGEIEYAQWNYRISCHPLRRDLPLNRLRPVDDLQSRLVKLQTLEDYAYSKAARFTLNPHDRDKFVDTGSYNWLLEEIMNEVPGKDNYQGNLKNYDFEDLAYQADDNKKPLNAAYYHRLYTVGKADASGNQLRTRGFSDQSLFMAMTSQEGIVGMNNVKCFIGNKECVDKSQKWTYAIPLEIIYLTPLQSWNPYNLKYKGSVKSEEGKTVESNGADGTEEKPFNGTNSKKYFNTPIELFDGSEVEPDLADTTPSHPVHVLNPNGKIRKVTASGTRIFLPHMKDVGVIRQRYPIMPVYDEGSPIWKELDALEKMIMYSKKHSFMFNEPFSVVIGGGGGSNGTGLPESEMTLKTGVSKSSSTSQHVHTVTLSRDEYALIQNGGEVNVITSLANGHQHNMVLHKEDPGDRKCPSVIFYKTCDGEKKCRDKHVKCMAIVQPFV